MAYECAWNLQDTGSKGRSESCKTSTACISEQRQSTDSSTTEGIATIEAASLADDSSPDSRRRRMEAAASTAAEQAQIAAQAAEVATEAAAKAARAAAAAAQALHVDDLGRAGSVDELGGAEPLGNLKLGYAAGGAAPAGDGGALRPRGPPQGARGCLPCWGFVLRAAGHTTGLFIGLATALGAALADHRAGVTNAAGGSGEREPRRAGLAALLAAVPRAAARAAFLLLDAAGRAAGQRLHQGGA
ncbi:unnamed protein product [Prorocentrum cordatum]|uniref:Solute carrier family 40 protein n=1 Tax=Prorocentrum cordatum TaxID=2364126 RepID=A0ABN9R1V5_9DINO|nr:unnamed protein product [Polarella glacialis]